MLALALPFSAAGRAAANDLATEPTTKGGPEPTSKDLSTTGTLTPTPKAPGTGGVAKVPGEAAPKPTASAAESAAASASESASADPAPSSSAQPPGSAPTAGPRPFARKKVPLGVGDLAVSLSMPEAWSELPAASLPEVEENKDVTVVTRKGFGVHDPKGKPPVVEEIIVACGKASGEFWADAIRDAAFTQMIAAVEKEAAKYSTLKSIEPEAVRAEGDRFLQSFAADAEFSVDGKAAPGQVGKGKPKVASTVKLQGVSFIGFFAAPEAAGKTPDIIACSVACAELTGEGATPLCATAIGSLEISGAFAPPPKRSFVAELLFKLKKDPTTLWLGVIGVVFVALAGVLVAVLAARKKRHAEQDDHEAHEHEDEFDAGYHAGVAAAQAAAEVKATMHASPPPAEGFYDPQTLTRRKL